MIKTPVTHIYIYIYMYVSTAVQRRWTIYRLLCIIGVVSVSLYYTFWLLYILHIIGCTHCDTVLDFNFISRTTHDAYMWWIFLKCDTYAYFAVRIVCTAVHSSVYIGAQYYDVVVRLKTVWVGARTRESYGSIQIVNRRSLGRN